MKKLVIKRSSRQNAFQYFILNNIESFLDDHFSNWLLIFYHENDDFDYDDSRLEEYEYLSKLTYDYTHESFRSTSEIDHFFISPLEKMIWW